MKQTSLETASFGIQTCSHCGSQDVIVYDSEKLEGYYLKECNQCHKISEIYRADAFKSYKNHRPIKTNSPKTPWILRFINIPHARRIDRRPPLIRRIIQTLKNKRYW